jgi:hypothetical protein
VRATTSVNPYNHESIINAAPAGADSRHDDENAKDTGSDFSASIALKDNQSDPVKTTLLSTQDRDVEHWEILFL